VLAVGLLTCLAAPAAAGDKIIELPLAGLRLQLNPTALHAPQKPDRLLTGGFGGVGFSLEVLTSKQSLADLAATPVNVKPGAVKVEVKDIRIAGRDGKIGIYTLQRGGMVLGGSAVWTGPKPAVGGPIFRMTFTGMFRGNAEAKMREILGTVEHFAPKAPERIGQPVAKAEIEGLEFALPIGWTVSESRIGSTVLFAMPVQPTGVLSRSYLKLSGQKSLSETDFSDEEDFAAARKTLQAWLDKAGHKLVEVKQTSIVGKPAIQYAYKEPGSDGRIVVRRTFFQTNRMYTLEMKQAGDDAKALTESFEAILATFPTQWARPGRPTDPHFQCQKCNKVFSVTNAELARILRTMAEKNETQRGFGIIPCQVCGAKNAAVVMDQCPTCKKWFVSQTARQVYRNGPGAMKNMPKNFREKCPHCGVDIIDARKKAAAGR
jgi:hypothetical protein